MSNLIPFNFESNSIRAVIIDDEPWFVASDVAIALEYSRYDANLIKHVPHEWKGTNQIRTLGGMQNVSIISEQGLYFFIARSDKPKAIKFQKWLAGEVVPSIRKNGGYIAGQENTDDPELIMARALQVAQNIIERKSRELQDAKTKLLQQQPAVEFAEKYGNAVSGNIGFRQVCKLFNENERWMREFLKKNKIMYKLGGEWTPYQQHIDAERFSVKTGVAEHDSGESHAYVYSKFTPKGVRWLAGLIYEHRIKQGELS